MSITTLADSDDLNSIIKRSLVGVKPKENAEVITKKSTVNVSNTITSLHNAFNQIYAYTLNVKNIHTSEEKRLKNIKKEVTMESRARPASLAGGSSMDVGNLPDIFKQLTESIQDLNKSLEKLDMSSTGDAATNIDVDVDDNDRRRGRGRGRGRGFRLPRGMGRLAGAAALGLGARWVVAKGLDMGAGAFGVGQGLDETAIAAQDEENWNRANTMGRVQSSIPRGIEATGRILGFSNMAAQARADRVRGETSYLQRTQGRTGASTSTAAERQLQTAAANVTRRGNRLERATPIGTTSASSRFADFMNQSIANMSSWAMAAARLTPLGAALAAGASFFDYGGEGTGDGTGSWAEQIGLVQSESGGNLGALNSEGYGGRLQFGTARLADAALAGVVPFGTTGAQFSLMTAQQQLAVENWHFSDIDRQAERLGINRYIGQTIAGVPINQSSIRAMAHLGGIGGVQRFVTSGGRYDPADSNGTKLSDYGRRFNRIITSIVDRSAGGTGRISSGYGMRTHPRTRRRTMHDGIDIAAPTGTPVASLQSGSVIFAGMGTLGSGYSGYGNVVHIHLDNGNSALYAHLHRISPGVRQGTRVTAAQIIGQVGSTGTSTGAHLHFELSYNGVKYDPEPTYNRNPWIVGGKSAAAEMVEDAGIREVQRYFNRRSDGPHWSNPEGRGPLSWESLASIQSAGLGTSGNGTFTPLSQFDSRSWADIQLPSGFDRRSGF